MVSPTFLRLPKLLSSTSERATSTHSNNRLLRAAFKHLLSYNNYLMGIIFMPTADMVKNSSGVAAAEAAAAMYNRNGSGGGGGGGLASILMEVRKNWRLELEKKDCC